MKVDGDLGDERLLALLQRVEELAIAAVQLVARPSRDANFVGQSPVDHLHRDLRFGVKLDLVRDVCFFRRAGSLANSFGKYNWLSSNT